MSGTKADPLDTPSTADLLGKAPNDPKSNPFIPRDSPIDVDEESNSKSVSPENDESQSNSARKPSTLTVDTSRERTSSLSNGTDMTPSPSESIAKRKPVAKSLVPLRIPDLGNKTRESEVMTATDNAPQTAELLSSLAAMPGATPLPLLPDPLLSSLSTVKTQLLAPILQSQTQRTSVGVVADALKMLLTAPSLQSQRTSAGVVADALKMAAEQLQQPSVNNPVSTITVPISALSQVATAGFATLQQQAPARPQVVTAPAMPKPQLTVPGLPPQGDTLVHVTLNVNGEMMKIPLKLTPEQLALATAGGGLPVVPPSTIPLTPPCIQKPVLTSADIRNLNLRLPAEPKSELNFMDDSMNSPTMLQTVNYGGTFGGTDAELRASQILQAVAGVDIAGTSSQMLQSQTPQPQKYTTVQERNKAAAVRYRKRKKDELVHLQKRVVELETKNLELATQVNVLKDELDRVNDMLDEHRDCPINKRRRIDPTTNQIIVKSNTLSSTLAAADSTQMNGQQQFVVEPFAKLRASQAQGISVAPTQFESSPSADILVNALTSGLGSGVNSLGGVAADANFALLSSPSDGNALNTLADVSTRNAPVGTAATSAAIVEWITQQAGAGAVGTTLANTLAGTSLTTQPAVATMAQDGSPGIVLQPIMIPGLNKLLLPYLQVKSEAGPAGSVVVVSEAPK